MNEPHNVHAPESAYGTSVSTLDPAEPIARLSNDFCALVFDDESGDAVLVEENSDGGFRIVRAPVGTHSPATSPVAPGVRKISTIMRGWGAFTKRVEIGITRQSTDETVTDKLIKAIEANQHPDLVIDPTFNETACTWTRAGETISFTQVERKLVNDTRRAVLDWLEESGALAGREADPPYIRIETRTSALLRLWKQSRGDVRIVEEIEGVSTGAGAETNQLERQHATVALVTIERGGFTFGLHNERKGLVYETEEAFGETSVEMAVNYAIQRFFALVAPESLTDLQIAPVTKIIFSAEREMRSHLKSFFDEELKGIHAEEISLPVSLIRDSGGPHLDHASALAMGLVLADHEQPHGDLSVNPRELLTHYIAERRKIEQERERQLRRIAAVAILAPLVAVLAVILSSWIYLKYQASVITETRVVEEREAERLAKERNLRQTAEQNFSFYSQLTEQIVALRKRQTAMPRLLADLNASWPSTDNTWFVSDLKVGLDGSIEIKGKTKREESVTQFARALEFSDGRFINIQPERTTVGVGLQNGPPQPPYIEWVVRGIYTPLAQAAKPVTPAGAQPPPDVGAPPLVPPPVVQPGANPPPGGVQQALPINPAQTAPGGGR